MPAQSLRIFRLALLLAAARLLIPNGTVGAQDLPATPHWPVTDNARAYNQYILADTVKELRHWQNTIHHPIVIWTDASVPADTEAWCHEAFERWRTDRTNLDDGAALFVLTEAREIRLEAGPRLAPKLPPDAADQIAGIVAEVDGAEDAEHRNPIVWTLYATDKFKKWLGPIPPEPPSPEQLELDRRAHRTNLEALADDINDGDYAVFIALGAAVLAGIVFLIMLVTHPLLTLEAVLLASAGGILGSATGGSGGGGGFSGGGGSFGGGGSSGKW
jgi:uncharacterized protein